MRAVSSLLEKQLAISPCSRARAFGRGSCGRATNKFLTDEVATLLLCGVSAMRVVRVAGTLLVIGAVIVSEYWGPKNPKEDTQSALTEGEKMAAPASVLLFSAPEPDHQRNIRIGAQPVQWPEVKPSLKTRAATAMPKHVATKTVAGRKPQTGYVSIEGRPL
jgi:hypothetical protein